MAEERYIADAVVTVDDQHRVFRPGIVDVIDGRISWVGAAEQAPNLARQVVRVGGLLMPGLVNTHAHSAMTLLRSAGDGLALGEWLSKAVWPREAFFTDEDAYWGMLLGADEMLRNGVTATCEHYLHPTAVAQALVDSGMRAVFTPGIFDLPGPTPGQLLMDWRTCLEQAMQVHSNFNGKDNRIEIGFGPHSAYTLSAEALATTAQTAQSVGALLQIHLAETEQEGRLIEATHGLSAPDFLASLGVFDGRVLAAHAVWMSNADLDIMERHDVAVAHCPGSNGKLGSGVARVAEMRRRGLRVGLGTDGPSSNDALDLWREMRLAPLLARAVSADPAAMTTEAALELATWGGADALGFTSGSLAPGRAADMIRVEMSDSRLTPALSPDELLAHLVWSASSRQVTDVWVAGRHVVSGGRCMTIDSDSARGEVTRRALRIFEQTRRQGV